MISNLIPSSCIIHGHSYKAHIDTILNIYGSETRTPSEMIANRFGDSLNYCQHTISVFDLKPSSTGASLSALSYIAQPITFNSYKEAVDFLETEIYTFFFVKAFIAKDSKCTIFVHVQDNLPNFRNNKINQILGGNN